jgi:hypothetical protein
MTVVLKEEVGRLREYLAMWVEWQRSYSVVRGAPCASSFAREESGARSASEFLERSDNWAMHLVEASVDDLRKRHDGEIMRTALRMRWLNEVGPSEFRAIRIDNLSREQADHFADLGERALVDIVKRRGLSL